MRSTSQQSTATNDIDDVNTEDESITTEDNESNHVPRNLHIQAAPTLEAILDEVGELTSGASFTQRNRDQEQILREMDHDDTDGIRHRRPTPQVNNTMETDATIPATASSSASTASNLATASKSKLNHQDSTDKAANTENCTNENSENGNVIEDLPYDSSEPAAESISATAPIAVESTQQIESKENEFRIKLKYLNDELKLVKGCPNEFIGDFKK